MSAPAPAPSGIQLPQVESAQIVVAPPAEGPGNWAGAPSACYSDGRYYLAYRLRRQVDKGRGYAVAIATSSDGVEFETISVLSKGAFGAASLERPALVKGPGGTWRIYVSCATVGTAHWWVDAIDAADPARFDAAARRTILPGDDRFAVKDPVVIFDGDKWMLWACLHPLSDPDATDRMFSRYAVSADGIEWTFEGDAFEGRPGLWDARGARISHVWRSGSDWCAYYDGRATAGDNAEELTGVAIGPDPGRLQAIGSQPCATSPWGSGSLRYLTFVDPGSGPARMYFEACLPDGSHGLFTQTFDSPSPA
jgi:hypothetical protein